MLTSFLCASVILSAPPPKAPDRPIYFPAEVGAKWETLLTGQPSGGDIHYSFSVGSVEEKDGETIVTLKRHDTPRPSDGGKYKLSKDGIYDMGSSRSFGGRSNTPLIFDPPLHVLKYPVKKDEKWEWNGKYGDDARSETRTIVAIEELKVPAGMYKAAKVEVVGYRASTGNQKWKSTEWFAEGIGRVKSVADNLTDEMTKFTPTKR